MKTSVIFNYFNPSQRPALLRLARFAIEGLLESVGEDCEVVCADGSGRTCDSMAALTGPRFIYAPCEQAESFAVTYNRGASIARGEVLVFCASDILFSASWLEQLTQPLLSGGAAMTCPYLSYSDYSAQCFSTPLRRTTFEPCCMTINVNALRREVWERVGPLDVSFTGNYNDIDYLVRLRQVGLRALIVDCGLITHLGGATLSTSSLLRAEQDRATFAKKHPGLATTDFWHRCWDPLLCRSKLFRAFLLLGTKSAPRHRRPLRVANFLRWEPLFNRVSAT